MTRFFGFFSSPRAKTFIEGHSCSELEPKGRHMKKKKLHLDKELLTGEKPIELEGGATVTCITCVVTCDNSICFPTPCTCSEETL